MTISYYGHSAVDVAETDRLLDAVRAALPADTWSCIRLGTARPLAEPFGAEIARDFGIEAQSCFTFTLVDTERAYLFRSALIAEAYARFGPGRLVITWELDFVVPPTGETPGEFS